MRRPQVVHLLGSVDSTDLIQVLRATVAAVAAWQLSHAVFGGSQPFLAPWSALITVNATVLRTFSHGAQQVAAAFVGVILARLAVLLVGVEVYSFAVTMLVCLLIGLSRPLRAESMTAATTALFVMLTGQADEGTALLQRLAETGLGVGVGVVVAVAVWPPLQGRTALHRVHAIESRMADLLEEVASTVRGGGLDVHLLNVWMGETRSIDAAIDSAWGVVRQAWESGRMNPRLRAAHSVRTSHDLTDVLDRLEQAVSEQRSMLRTLALSTQDARNWDEGFREPWLRLLERTGRALREGDGPAAQDVLTALTELAHSLSTDWLKDAYWPEYGALVVNLRHIAAAASDVAGVDGTPAGR